MKRILIAMLAAVMVLSLVGCGGGSKKLKGEVSFMGWGDEAERVMYDKVFKDFEAKKPGVKVNYIFTPDDYYTKLQTMIAGNTAPRCLLPGRGPAWPSTPRTGSASTSGPYEKKYPELTKDFVPGVLRYGTYQDKLYAHPEGLAARRHVHQRGYLQGRGRPPSRPPTGPWTTIAPSRRSSPRSRARRRVQYGCAVENYRADWMTFGAAYGGEWFKDGKSNWSDPNVIKGMNVMRDVIVTRQELALPRRGQQHGPVAEPALRDRQGRHVPLRPLGRPDLSRDLQGLHVVCRRDAQGHDPA